MRLPRTSGEAYRRGVVLTTVGPVIVVLSTFVSHVAKTPAMAGSLFGTGVLTYGVMELWNWRNLPPTDDPGPTSNSERWRGIIEFPPWLPGERRQES